MPQKSNQPKPCADNKFNFFAAILIAFTIMPFTAYAEPTITWDQKYYNPAPAEDDFILPMPCGGAMAFRKIYVASQGPLYDEKIRLGFLGDENKYAEYWRDAYISGAFESENG